MSLKVLVIGGGPVGLTLAHTLLTIPNVEFVVLEQRHSIFKDVGASLILNPASLRVFQQLGLLDPLLQIGAPLLHHSQGFDFSRNKFKPDKGFPLLRENLGCALTALHRADLVHLLYDSLPDESKAHVHTGKRLADILLTPTGVEALCEDGTSYTGTFLVGADGAHSEVRSVMRRLALGSKTQSAPLWGPEPPFVSHYKCLWASFPRPSHSGDSYETQGRNRSAMYLTGKRKGWLFLYEKLPQPSTTRKRYDDQSITEFADSFAEWHVTGSLKVKDVLTGGAKRVIVGMSDLEEGVVTRIAWAGRIVLVGDAAHKFTPNAGLGFNNGVQDVASLYNQLGSLQSPDADSLQTSFEMYQQDRSLSLKRDFDRSAGATRLSAWETWRKFVSARFIYPLGFLQKYWSTKNSLAMAEGLVLENIAADEPFEGRIPWRNQLKF